MQLSATIVNALWTAANTPAWLRFRRAVQRPRRHQRRILRRLLAANAGTAFGREHGFAEIRSAEEFARRVPPREYAAFEPWISRIRNGEPGVLTHEPVTHLIPTSGSAGRRKLIPFTAGLQRQFHAAIGCWLVDLQRQSPGLMGGPAYWSVTPVMQNAALPESVVPIGFETDAAYLGGTRRRLAERVMAVPPEVQAIKSLAEFRYQTLLYLLRSADLRLVSIWHPSFFRLLLDELPRRWEQLLNELAADAGMARRVRNLREADPFHPSTIWPNLRVISCWADNAAAGPAADLGRRFPNTLLQPKGLLASEAFVTLPFAGQHPLAITSHYFEFMDESGRVLMLEGLREGGEYEVLVTTAGGLWRYRLGDRVRVTGWVAKTPSLRFLGRAGNVSDRCGEKLSEPFVVEALRTLFGNRAPRFVLLAPDDIMEGCCYTLYLEGRAAPDLPGALDRVLRQNPHYDYCRDLGQIQFPRLFLVSSNGFEAYAARQAAHGSRLGDIKPAVLSPNSGWSEFLKGHYVSCADSNCLHPAPDA